MTTTTPRPAEPSRDSEAALDLADDSGLTLVELLVAGVIMTIVLAAAVSLMIGIFSTHGLASGKSDSTLGARNFSESISRTVRVATTPTGKESAFVTAKPHELEFYASLQRGGTQDALHPTRVRYYYDSALGCLRESQVPVTIVNGQQQYIPSSAVERCVAHTAAAPLFQYYADGREVDNAGNEVQPLPAGATGVPTKTGTTACKTTPADTRCIVSVRVKARVTAEVGSKDRPTALDFRITLTNKFFPDPASPSPSPSGSTTPTATASQTPSATS